MAAAESIPLWRQIVGQSLRGRRGVVKTVHIWLPVSVVVAMSGSSDLERTVIACFQLLLAAALYGQAGILTNDLNDRDDDCAADKDRWIRGLSSGRGVLVVGLLVVLGSLVLFPGAPNAGVFLAYGAAVALGLLYSVRPVRLKERGVFGPLAYSLASTLGYAVVPWAWLGGSWHSLAFLAPAVLLDKWVNLHFHQVVDYAADRRSGTRTFVVAAGLPNGRRSLRWACCMASISMLAFLVFLALEQPDWGLKTAGAGVAVAVFAGIYADISRRRSHSASALVRELPWHYLGLTYSLFRVLPLILFSLLALREPTMWFVFGVVFLALLVESWYSVRYRYE